MVVSILCTRVDRSKLKIRLACLSAHGLPHPLFSNKTVVAGWRSGLDLSANSSGQGHGSGGEENVTRGIDLETAGCG